MPKSSKTSGKTNAEPKSGQEKLLFDFDVYEEKYQVFKKLSDDLKLGLSELKPNAYYDYFLTQLVTFNSGFSIGSAATSKRLRDADLFLGHNLSAEEIIKESSQYQFELTAYAKSIFKQQVKKGLLEQIKVYQDLFPFEAKYLLDADPDDRFKPEFIAYIFFSCHKYAALLSEKVDQHLPDYKDVLQEAIERIIDAQSRYPITKQVLMIVLQETGLLKCLIAEEPFGSKKTDILISKIFGGNEDSIRKIRAGIIDIKQKDCPYKLQHPTNAAKILRSLGYPEKADALLTKFGHLAKD